MNTMSFYEFRSEKTGSGSRSYIFKENKIISLTNLFQQYIKNSSEWEIEFLSTYYREKAQMHIDQKIWFTRIIFLLLLKYNRIHQHNTHQKADNVTIFYYRANIF